MFCVANKHALHHVEVRRKTALVSKDSSVPLFWASRSDELAENCPAEQERNLVTREIRAGISTIEFFYTPQQLGSGGRILDIACAHGPLARFRSASG